MSKSKKTSTEHSTTTNALDPTYSSAVYGNLAHAQQAAAQLTPYSGQRVAGFTDTQRQAQQNLLGVAASGVGSGFLNAAGQAATAAAAYRPLQVAPTSYQAATITAPKQVAATQAQAAQIAPASTVQAAQIDRNAVRDVSGAPVTADQISAYFNPYEQQVVSSTLADLDRQRQIEQLGNAAAATRAHAFGGTGAAVLQSLTNDAYARQSAQAAANLRQQGYSTAVSAAQADAQRRLQAEQANQGVDLSVAGQNASSETAARTANAEAENARATANAGFANTVNLENAGRQSQADLAYLGLVNANAQADAAALNQAAQFNASQDFAAQGQNQQAGLTANSQAVTAAGLLGDLSGLDLSQAITRAGLIGQVGDAEQAQAQHELDAALAAWEQGKDLTLQQQQMVNSTLALLPVTQTTTNDGKTTTKESGFDGADIFKAALSLALAPATGGTSLLAMVSPSVTPAFKS